MPKVLVEGSTGLLGKCVVADLKRRGYDVRAIARDKGKLAGVEADEVVVADLTRPETLRGVCDGSGDCRIHALMDFCVAVTQIEMLAPKFGSRRLGQYFETASMNLTGR